MLLLIQYNRRPVAGVVGFEVGVLGSCTRVVPHPLRLICRQVNQYSAALTVTVMFNQGISRGPSQFMYLAAMNSTIAIAAAVTVIAVTR